MHTFAHTKWESQWVHKNLQWFMSRNSNVPGAEHRLHQGINTVSLMNHPGFRKYHFICHRVLNVYTVAIPYLFPLDLCPMPMISTYMNISITMYQSLMKMLFNSLGQEGQLSRLPSFFEL